MGKQPKKNPSKEEDRLAGGVIGGAILGVSLGGPPVAIVGALTGLFLAWSMNEDKEKPRKLTLKNENVWLTKK